MGKGSQIRRYIGRRKTGHWTPDEDDRLKMLLRQYRYTYDEISDLLNRTEGAIKRRMITLKLTERPVRREDKSWSEGEVETLLKMRQSGHHWEEIGKVLGRSGSATRGKYERLQNPDYMKKIKKSLPQPKAGQAHIEMKNTEHQ